MGSKNGGILACCGCNGQPPLPIGKDAEISEQLGESNPCLEGDALENVKPAEPTNQVDTNEEDNPVMIDENQDLDGVRLIVPETSDPLRVLFRCPAGVEAPKRFRSRPLGVIFEAGSKPLKVKTVSGQAAAMGVKQGWVLEAMHGSNPSKADRLASATSDQIVEELRRATGALPYVEKPMEVVFQSERTTKVVAFTQRPFGFSISSDALPAKVTQSSGHAAELGVEVGWTLHSVDGTSVDDSRLSFKEVADVVAKAQQRLPYVAPTPSVLVVFRDKYGQHHRKLFDERPLGVRFDGTGLPFTVTSIDPQAEVLGIQEGWVVVSIAGKDLESEQLTFNGVHELLKSHVSKLPTQGKPKLDLVFQPETAKRLVTFTRRPLEIDFMEGPPLTVLKANGHSAEKGVQPGWVVTAFGTEDASRLEMDRARTLWKQAEAKLPLEAPSAPELPRAPSFEL